MNFIPQLADDPRIWEILGIREVSCIDEDPSALSLQFFCFCDENPPPRAKQHVRVLNLPIAAIKHVKPGSRWKNGERATRVLRWCKTRPVNPSQAKLVLCRRPHSTEDVIKKISRAKDPHLSFTKLINHIFYKGSHYSVRIPCSELIRHFLFPTLRFGASVMTGKFDEYVGIHKAEPNTLQRSATKREKMTTKYLSSSAEGLRAVRHPFKTLQMSYINRMATRNYFPILLSAVIPAAGYIDIRMSVIGGTTDDTVAVQLHGSTGGLSRYYNG